MGCVCCSLSSFVSILLDALERISLCTVCAMLTCCLLLTILTMMILGIGIGYHYCFVQSAVDAMEKAAQASRGGGEHVGDAVRTIDRAMRKKSISAHRVKRRDADLISMSNNDTLSDKNRIKFIHAPNGTYFENTYQTIRNVILNNHTDYTALNTTNITVTNT